MEERGSSRAGVTVCLLDETWLKLLLVTLMSNMLQSGRLIEGITNAR